MSRVIKFRAWDKKYKKMYYGDIKIALAFPDDDVEIMQYTGLTDKHGKEIYENDIVKSLDYDNAMIVMYEEIQASDDMTAPGIGYQFNTFPEEMEIIGNVHENSELLNK